ncbi:hypothetical protein [Winogradskyella sp.]|uniref:hypothetical protein n=1 Tax=Winogradskyella sp. TaxID=1883156 RepID=UPI002607080E|nr:hypothetical protein [Winogradskyella sp.]
MDNFDDLTIHFTINGIIIVMFQLAMVVSSIIIVSKYRTIGAIIMLAGACVSLLAVLAFQLVPLIMNHSSSNEFMATQVVLSYFNTFSFFVFMMGFLIFAVNDLKKAPKKA